MADGLDDALGLKKKMLASQVTTLVFSFVLVVCLFAQQRQGSWFPNSNNVNAKCQPNIFGKGTNKEVLLPFMANTLFCVSHT